MPAASQATSAPGCLPAQQNVGSDSMASAPSSRHELWVEGALGAEAVFRRSRWAMADPAGSPGRQRHRLGATAAAARISNDQPWPDRPARCPRHRGLLGKLYHRNVDPELDSCALAEHESDFHTNSHAVAEPDRHRVADPGSQNDPGVAWFAAPCNDVWNGTRPRV